MERGQYPGKNWLDAWSASDEIGVIASGVALLQFAALIATFFLMRRTAERQLRAYIGVASGHLAVEFINGVFKPTVTIRVRNFGQTPAYHVHSKGSITLAAEFSASLNERLLPIGGKNALFPQSDQRILLSQDFNNPPGTTPLETFVFGYVSYRDAFGKQQRTNFRFTCISNAPQVPGPFQADLSPCEEGNEAT
jgi:hypothetical protein